MPENWWRSRDLSCPPTREQLSREGSVVSEMSVDLILGWGVGGVSVARDALYRDPRGRSWGVGEGWEATTGQVPGDGVLN